MNLFALVAELPALSRHPSVDGGVTNVRFFDGLAPRGTLAPYATWQGISLVPENMLAGAPEFDRTLTQIDVWADDPPTARSIAGQIRTILEPHGYITAWRELAPADPDAVLYRASFAFSAIE